MKRDVAIARLKAAEPQIRAHGVAALYLYGSLARDEARQGSDVDVFVDPANDRFYDLENFMGAYRDIQRALGGSEIGYVTRNGLSAYIRAAVEREAVRVF